MINRKQILLTQSNSKLEFTENRVVIQLDRQVTSIAITEIEMVVVMGEVKIDFRCLQAFLHHRIPATFLDYQGKILGRLEPFIPERLAGIQAQAALTEECRLKIFHSITWVALQQRCRFLQRFQREHEIDLQPFIQQIEFALNPLNPRYPKRHPTTISSCIGLMGSGMKAYWTAFPSLIRVPGFEFLGRTQGGRINLMLESVYSLLYQVCESAIATVGLEPAWGIWHRDHPKLAALPLVLDLSTEFKILAEATVLRCVNRGQIALKDFADQDQLPGPVRSKLIQAWGRKLQEKFRHPVTNQVCNYHQAIYIQALLLREALLKGAEQYQPLLLK